MISVLLAPLHKIPDDGRGSELQLNVSQQTEDRNFLQTQRLIRISVARRILFPFVCFYCTAHDVFLFYICSVMRVHWLVWWPVFMKLPPCSHLVWYNILAISTWNQYFVSRVLMYDIFLKQCAANNTWYGTVQLEKEKLLKISIVLWWFYMIVRRLSMLFSYFVFSFKF